MLMRSASFYIGIVLLLLTSACSSVRSGGNRYVDTFYKGKGNILFHVNAFRLPSNKKNPDVVIDFTYNYIKDSTQNVSILFSLVGKQFIKGPYKTYLQQVAVDSLYLMFAEIRGRKYLTRLAGSIPFSTFDSIFQNSNIDFTIHHDKGLIDIQAARKWKKVAHHIRIDMLDVIRLTEAQ